MYRATQLNDLSAGAACLSFIANLAGLPISEHDLLKEIGVQPGVGADPLAMVQWCRATMPDQTGECGEESYRGGVAVANVIDPCSMQNHYVVLLRSSATEIEYWCPSQGVVRMPRANLQWRSGTSEYREWAINFPTLTAPERVDYLPRVWLVIGKDDSLTDDNGCIFEMLDTLHCYGVPATWHSASEMMLKDSTLWIAGVPVRPEDVVLTRFGSRSQAQAADFLRVLSQARAQFVNSPAGQLVWQSKMDTVGLKKEPCLIVASPQEMRRAAEELFLRGHVRLAVRKLGTASSQLSQHVQTVDEAVRSFAWAARVVGYAGVAAADNPVSLRYQTRVLVAYGEIVAAVQGCYRDFKRVALSAEQLVQVQQIQAALQCEGIQLATLVLQDRDVVSLLPGDLTLLSQLQCDSTELSQVVEALIGHHRIGPPGLIMEPVRAA